MSGHQNLRQNLSQSPAVTVSGHQSVKFFHHARVIGLSLAVNGEHSGGVAHADDLFAGQLPVHITGQGRNEIHSLHVGLLIEHRLVKMRDAPAQRQVKVEFLRQQPGRFLGSGISPGAERAELIALLVKRQITVHHSGNAHGRHLGQRRTVPFADILRQLPEAGLHTGPNVVQVISPIAVLQAVFPVIAAGGDGGVGVVDENSLDPGGAQLDAQEHLSIFDFLFHGFIHDDPSLL